MGPSTIIIIMTYWSHHYSLAQVPLRLFEGLLGHGYPQVHGNKIGSIEAGRIVIITMVIVVVMVGVVVVSSSSSKRRSRKKVVSDESHVVIIWWMTTHPVAVREKRADRTWNGEGRKGKAFHDCCAK